MQEASELISKSFLNDYYIGFIEPNKITSGDCDIIISDGYTGNIMLKSAEGISDFIISNLRTIYKKSLLNKFSYKLIEKDYERILSEFQIILDLSLEDTQKKLDKALKRNLEKQTPKPTEKAEMATDENLVEAAK